MQKLTNKDIEAFISDSSQNSIRMGRYDNGY